MGDDPAPSGPGSDYPRHDPQQPGQTIASGQSGNAQARLGKHARPEFVPHPQQQPQQQHLRQQQSQSTYGPSPQPFSSQLDMPQPATSRQGSFNMSGMAAALPQNAYRSGTYPSNQQQQRLGQVASSPSMMPQMPQMPQMQQYHNQGGMPMNPQYYVPQHAQMPQYYGGQMPHPQHQGNVVQRQAVAYYPSQLMMNQQATHGAPGYYYPQAGHFQGQASAMPANMMMGQYMPASPVQADPRLPTQGPLPDQVMGSPYPASDTPTGPEASDSRSGVVRGPPRKPRQSGHAIWIGNLPPQTDLMTLVHHVCKEAPGLESLFLISKSNCAFANFKDDPTCTAAQQKLHDSKFQSVRLVSRLRKSTVEGAAGISAPTGPASEQGTTASAEAVSPDGAMAPATEVKTPVTDDANASKDKFFILKSLTVEDLDLSVRTGIWATQAHNEDTLNNAFKTADNVYLVFSANKSGEYFGYGRMVSEINEDPAAAIQFAPKAQSANDTDLPKAIPTDATEFAPKGRIIDDSARGTIFWEAEREDGESADEADESDASSKEGQDGESKAWGKPFKLEWMATSRLPFYRTRGLRNPWNSNREVKIARDGTELEPSVGRKLIGLFNRVQSPVPPNLRGGVVLGFPPMRVPYQ